MTRGAFVDALRRMEQNNRAIMFKRLAPHALDDREHVLLARVMGILPMPSGRTVAPRVLFAFASRPSTSQPSTSQAWQDQAGTIPARDGDPVRRWDDASSYGSHLLNGWAVTP